MKKYNFYNEKVKTKIFYLFNQIIYKGMNYF